MIIWLASYPKSGNTWLRFLITSLLLKGRGSASLEQLGAIKQFPSKKQYQRLNIENINYLDLNHISKYWIETQKLINTDKSIKFFKTHNALCKINNNIFTDLNNTLGVIYIVRDPRNVLTSLNNHYHHVNFEFSKKFILDESKGIINTSKITTNNDFALPQIIGSWKTHYNSWKNMKKNYLLIKYEDLVKNPKEEFNKIAIFLGSLFNNRFSVDVVNNAIELSSFNKLKEMEEKHGFTESSVNEKGEKNKFFYLGPKNDWQKILNNNLINEINKEFATELKELGYL